MKSWAALVFLLLFSCLNLRAANIGTVVPVVGQVSDLAYDSARNLVYLANPTRNEVEVYSVGTSRLTGALTAGLQPGSLAISPDNSTLYVANIGSLSVSAINLDAQRSVAEYFVGSRPDAIAVGADGQLVILGTGGLQRLDPISRQIIPVPISPPATPVTGVTVGTSTPPATFLAGLVPAAGGNLIIGLSVTTGTTPGRLFVYEVASGTVLRSRNVSGLRAILSASTDGSRFMAGPFLFDTQTLTILGRSGTSTNTLVGGSAFSIDGNSVFASFNTQNAINPLNTNNPQNPGGATIPGGIPGQPGAAATQSVLQVLRSSSLAPQLGLRLAEPITSKMIASADGQYLFANSTSGILAIPIGQLNNLPVLGVSATNVVLSVDPCNRTIATATVQITNLGGGRMTFAAGLNPTTGPVSLSTRSGVAPTTLTITFDARSLSATAFNTLQFAVVLVSPEAVNIEPAILVNVNYRDVSQRGTIVPVNGVGVDMQMDSARQFIYIANYTNDQIEVFSLTNQTFLPPIRVGNRPISMSMLNASTMVVANAGSENLSVVDLDALQEVDEIPMGPIALNGLAPLFPRSIAASQNAILFSAGALPAAAGTAPPTGAIWQLSLLTRTAFPRRDLGIGVANTVQGRNMLVAPADGSSVVTVESNGTLRLYDPISDAFVLTRTGAIQGQLRGTVAAASDGSSVVVDNSVFNSVLTLKGSISTLTPGGPIGPGGVPAAAAAWGVVTSGNSVIRVQGPQSNTTAVENLQRYNLSTLQMDFQVSLPEPVMDITPSAAPITNTTTRQWPPRVVAQELGTNNQTQVLPRGLAADSSNNVYLLTYSGLSIVSLASATGRVPTFTASGVVNSPSKTAPVSAGALISIFGSNLADSAQASAAPLPTLLGGVCVTANEAAIPLLITSANEIDAQLPPNLTTGRVTLTIRSEKLGVSSAGVQVQVNASSPSVFSQDIDGTGTPRAILFHSADMMLVTPDYPADRDEILYLYATGLGPATPGVPAGQLTPNDPVSATTQSVSVAIGGHPYPVISSVLAPGYVGVYQITIYVPGNRVQGNDLPVIVTAGGASSATTNPPLAAIQ
jgi:uncharacterized protein (TIGR03437 family)